MNHIDEKFKDCTPQQTVEKIRGILRQLNIEVYEKWRDSKVEHCYSLSVYAKGGVPFANGKGVTKDFARASAYGEFIERLQGGLFLNKYQSVIRNPEMDLQTFAPDAKYKTKQELINDGEWMDYIISAYKIPSLNREVIAKFCAAYACADEDRILTLPFYSIFEDKYVDLPMGFVDQIYSTNGCCVGNTKEEAWVHAFSEMMERHASVNMLTGGKAAPRIPDEVLDQYTTVSEIIQQIRETGDLDVEIFDYSIGNGFPVVSTRVISKKNHSYRVNVAADPVFEIALQRTLTEMFQGKSIDSVTSMHGGRIMRDVTDMSITSNVVNQLETSSGLYTADYFANELTCKDLPSRFEDNSEKSNKELLTYMLDLYRQLGVPVYVRNFSYLGFLCYRFVVPGFSEAFAVRLRELVPEYAISDQACKVYKNAAVATDQDLQLMLSQSKMIRDVFSRYYSFEYLSGIPVDRSISRFLTGITRAYAAYRLGKFKEAISYMKEGVTQEQDDSTRQYFECVNKYLEMKNARIEEQKIRVIIYKFFERQYADQLYACLDAGKTPYENYLICCDHKNCGNCKYCQYCNYDSCRMIYRTAGEVYKTFTNGQARSEFAV